MKLNGIAGWTAALWIGRNALAQEYDAIAGWAPLSNVTKHVRVRKVAQKTLLLRPLLTRFTTFGYLSLACCA
jgi:hypothetical protein